MLERHTNYSRKRRKQRVCGAFENRTKQPKQTTTTTTTTSPKQLLSESWWWKATTASGSRHIFSLRVLELSRRQGNQQQPPTTTTRQGGGAQPHLLLSDSLQCQPPISFEGVVLEGRPANKRETWAYIQIVPSENLLLFRRLVPCTKQRNNNNREHSVALKRLETQWRERVHQEPQWSLCVCFLGACKRSRLRGLVWLGVFLRRWRLLRQL